MQWQASSDLASKIAAVNERQFDRGNFRPIGVVKRRPNPVGKGYVLRVSHGKQSSRLRSGRDRVAEGNREDPFKSIQALLVARQVVDNDREPDRQRL